MKKYASLLAVFVLLLGIVSIGHTSTAASVPADTTAVIAKGKTQVTLGGEIRARGFWWYNSRVIDENGYGPASSPNDAGYDYRVRLNFEAKVTPNTTGYIELESGTFTSDNVTWGSQNGGARGNYPIVGNTKESNVTIRQAYIQYQGSELLGVPAGVKVGRQLIKLGYGLFYDHTYFGDDAILAFVQPMKELTIAGYYIKWSEGSRTRNDDANGYGILASYAGKGFGLSADITYVDHQNLAGWFIDPNGFLRTSTCTGCVSLANFKTHLWNIGLRGNVDDIAGTGLNFKADVEFQTGKIDVPVGDDPKFKGWAAMAGLDYKFKGFPLSLTLEYAFGSGQGDSDDIKAFISSLGQEQHYTFVYEYLTPSACDFGARDSRVGLCNTQYVKFGGAYDITKEIKAELYAYWLRAHKSVSINGYTPSKDIGWELDARLSYRIDRNLTYLVEAGYFWPGKAYRLRTGADADDAFGLRHGLTLRF